jgi:hypothetical protein
MQVVKLLSIMSDKSQAVIHQNYIYCHFKGLCFIVNRMFESYAGWNTGVDVSLVMTKYISNVIILICYVPSCVLVLNWWGAHYEDCV